MNSFVGSASRDAVLRQVACQRHSVIVAPPRHGKSTLLRDLASNLNESDFHVQEAEPGAEWVIAINHLRAFATKLLLPCDACKHKVFLLEDIDAMCACDRACLSEFKAVLQKLVGRVSIVATCTHDVLPNNAKWQKLVARISAWPTPNADLRLYADKHAFHSGAVARAVRMCSGSFPAFTAALLGRADASSEIPAFRDDVLSAVKTLLSTRPVLDTLDAMLDAFGGHTFVDTVVFNAATEAELEGSDFATRASRTALCGSAQRPSNSLDQQCRRVVNITRLANWRGCVGTQRRGPALKHSNVLAQAGARSATRKRLGRLWAPDGFTVAELVCANHSEEE